MRDPPEDVLQLDRRLDLLKLSLLRSDGRVFKVGHLSNLAQDEGATASGLVFVVRLLAARVERLSRPVELDDERDLVTDEWVGGLVQLGPHPQLVAVPG